MKYPIQCPHCPHIADSQDSHADSKADLRLHIEKNHPDKDVPDIWFTDDKNGNRIELIRKGSKREWVFLVTNKEGVTAPVAVDIDKWDLMGLGMVVINEMKK